MVIPVLFFLPLTLAVLSFLMRRPALDRYLVLLHAMGHLAGVAWMALEPCSWAGYFETDPPAVLVLALLAIVYLAVAVKRFLDERGMHHDGHEAWHSLQTTALMIFIGAMTAAALTNHAAMLWVFVEGTTLASAPLIYSSRTKTALEATWKYIFICSIGIALAFIGIILLMMGMEPGASLHFRDLEANAGKIDPFWLKFAFPFILVGFGTKAGFAPVHAWLPDAHSEAPSGISALLSATLLNTALLAVLRFGNILDAAGYGVFVRDALVVTGFLSLFVAAVYMLRVENYKRMLAYSSIENMGIMAIGFGLGGAGAVAAVLHMVAHSLVKGAFFLTAGDILHAWKRRDIAGAGGVLATWPRTGWVWLTAFVAISGLPPFAAFFSEIMLMSALLEAGYPVLLALFLLLLTVIIWGMGRGVLAVAMGPARPDLAGHRSSAIWPQVLLLGLAIAIVVAMPQPVETFFRDVAAILGVNGGQR
ncbi:MAG TPA: proton-conducting transporter membrane subunit [Spirochaetota bacterium]|mgnify:CR=1 FL=1|nr:proton-conducting transporter membrane subunit [Spirochaetota bacterium]HPH01957.1 proton-conducting transporter membrane subunit [Spirochaetota bacterium]HPN82099.1 proton-conducting transporter membrane subunit [Spirochaetota bacterium]